MDMSWQALLQEAAATSFEKTADTLAAAENDNCACIDLHQQQIHELSKKILLLPHQGRVLLLSRYCFRLSPEETEMFFHLENAKGHFRFYKELLSSSMGVEAGCMISDDTFVKACHIALSTMPFISAYLLLLIDEQVIQSVTNRNGITIRLIFSWTFQPLGLVLLPVFLAITTLLLLRLNRTYDIF